MWQSGSPKPPVTAGKARGASGTPAMGEKGRGGTEWGQGENRAPQCGPGRRETKAWVKRPLFNDRGDPSISVVRCRGVGKAGESERAGGGGRPQNRGDAGAQEWPDQVEEEMGRHLPWG